MLIVVEDLDLATKRIVQDAGWEMSLATGLVLSPVVIDRAAWTPELPLAREVARDGAAL